MMTRNLVARAMPVIAVTIALVGLTTVYAQRETREKHVFVTVTDKDDTPVTDLKATDFTVREDGVSREVLRIAPATGPMQIALLVDDSEVSQRSITQMRDGLAAFVQQMLSANPQTDITLMTFGDRPTVVVKPTTSAQTLGAAIERIFARQGAGAYLLQAISDASKDLKKREAARPVIVAFDIEDGVEFSHDTNQSIGTDLKNARASLWTVVLQERRGSPTSSEARERAMVLTDVATASGGGNKPLITRQAIQLGMTWAATLLNAQSDLTYSRPEALIPPNKLEVAINRRDVHLFAPRWATQ